VNDVFISVDVETDGPIPGDYSLQSIGAVVVDRPSETFYVELKPISDKFVPEALEITKLDRERLAREGVEPAEAMRRFADWVRAVAGRGRAVFVAFNATFDWSFVHWYFIHFVGESPFGISGLDVKAYYMGALGKRRWAETTKRHLEPRFRSDLPHTHNALDDAREQAEVFAKIRAYAERRDG
jgi:DNA polymerase III epsilon subunit-like protein